MLDRRATRSHQHRYRDLEGLSTPFDSKSDLDSVIAILQYFPALFGTRSEFLQTDD
jgi:hypothetical protein